MGLSNYILLKDTRNPILRASVGNSLALWLDASDSATITESGGAVSQWDDKSGNGNDVTQGTGSKQPTTNATTRNGKNVIDWDGGDGLELPSGLFSLPNGNYTMFAVSKRNTETASLEVLLESLEAASGKTVFGYSGTSGVLVFRNGPGPTVSKSGATNTDFQIIRARRDGTTQAITFNNATEATNTSAASESGIDSMTIGEAGTGANLIGSIAEILIYNRSLSTTEITNIERYLATKWNIGISAPDNIGGLRLWLDANDSSTITESGGAVSQWDDKSGNGNDALQSTGERQPLLVNNLFNGKSAIRFDGINDRLATDGTFAIGSNMTMFVVSKASATNNKQVFIEQTISLAALDGIQFNSRGNRPVLIKNGGVQVRPDENINWMGTDIALGSFMYDGANLEYFLNGVSLEVIAGVITNTTVTDNLYIGGRASSGTINTDGEIAEILIYNRALSTEEINAVDIYLSNKYGITLA